MILELIVVVVVLVSIYLVSIGEFVIPFVVFYLFLLSMLVFLLLEKACGYKEMCGVEFR